MFGGFLLANLVVNLHIFTLLGNKKRRYTSLKMYRSMH